MLIDDAINIYDELQIQFMISNHSQGNLLLLFLLFLFIVIIKTFIFIIKTTGISWFTTNGATFLSDDYNTLNPTKMDYRNLILKNMITLFDFHTFSFIRILQFFKLKSDYNNIAKRGIKWIEFMTNFLKEFEISLIKNFIPSWIYSTCMSLIQICDEILITIEKFDSSSLSSYYLVKCQLFMIAKVQVLNLIKS